MIITLLVSMAGGLGAVARLVLDGLIRGRHALEYPVGTTLINVSGSFLLGLLGGLALRHGLPTYLHLLLGTGFLGGYTTFSTASVETVRLVQDRRWLAAVANGFGLVVVASAAAAAGLALGDLS
jgi:fluoride exporter